MEITLAFSLRASICMLGEIKIVEYHVIMLLYFNGHGTVVSVVQQIFVH